MVTFSSPTVVSIEVLPSTRCWNTKKSISKIDKHKLNISTCGNNDTTANMESQVCW